MQERLRAKKIGNKKEFLREILQEVRVRQKEVTLTYKIPLVPPTPANQPRGRKFFTVLQMVVAKGFDVTF
jgi:hypothetical protein